MNNTSYTSSYTYLLWLYASIALLNIIGNTLAIPVLVYLTKPLLMGILLLYFWQNRHPNSQVIFQKWIRISLLFALFGDTFLMFEGEHFFLLGLSCFFITHISYIAAFLKYKSSNYQRKPVHLLAVFFFVSYYLIMVYFLWDHLPDIARIHVIAYSTVITMMAIVGTLFAAKISGIARWFLLIGIVLFVISDTCIAIDKFTDLYIPSPRFVIMFTYILAQFCIVFSSVKILQKS